MRLATFSTGGEVKSGIVEGEEVVVCAEGAGAEQALQNLIAGGEDARASWTKGIGGGVRHRLADVTLMAPIPEPRRDLICVGKNYHAHAREFHGSGFDSSGKEEVPSQPVVFTKATTSVIGPGAEIRASLDPTASVDYEVELAAVIGRRCFAVPRAKAYEVVFGYTIVNDVTSRELQQRHSQWTIGKSLDTFAPMGPVIVTADEIGRVEDLELETRVNGEIRQQACVRDLIFDIPTLIETLSATMTLLPGDIIATGTPAGVGIGFKPPRYLVPGDRVEVSISKIGTLENPVV